MLLMIRAEIDISLFMTVSKEDAWV